MRLWTMCIVLAVGVPLSGCSRRVYEGQSNSATAKQQELANAALAAVFEVELPEGALATNWRLSGGKDTYFTFRFDITTEAWPQLVSQSKMISTPKARSPDSWIDLPQWARAGTSRVTATDDLWTSDPVERAGMICWTVQDGEDVVSIAGFRRSSVSKLPSEVFAIEWDR